MTNFIEFKPGKEIEWLELNLLKNKTALSKSTIGRLCSYKESDVDSLIYEIEERTKLFNQNVYVIENNRIIPNFSWEDIPEYFLCLYYSYYGANDNSGGTKLFEKISASTLKNFLLGNIYTLGFPANKNLNEYLDEISEVCNESRLKLANKDYKDDGVDVVGYKMFDDYRGGNLYVLLQCAAGTHWTQKKPIEWERWTKYIDWYYKNIIVSISTVEFVPKKDWEKRNSTYGMLIDRIRIFNFLYKTPVENELRNEVKAWCTQKIAQGI